MKATDLVKYGDFKKFQFYGMEKLPNKIISTKYGEFDLSKIKWQDAMFKDFYDYTKGLSQIILRPNANFIAFLLDKVGKVDLIQSENDTLLYVSIRLN